MTRILLLLFFFIPQVTWSYNWQEDMPVKEGTMNQDHLKILGFTVGYSKLDRIKQILGDPHAGEKKRVVKRKTSKKKADKSPESLCYKYRKSYIIFNAGWPPHFNRLSGYRVAGAAKGHTCKVIKKLRNFKDEKTRGGIFVGMPIKEFTSMFGGQKIRKDTKSLTFQFTEMYTFANARDIAMDGKNYQVSEMEANYNITGNFHRNKLSSFSLFMNQKFIYNEPTKNN